MSDEFDKHAQFSYNQLLIIIKSSLKRQKPKKLLKRYNLNV